MINKSLIVDKVQVEYSAAAREHASTLAMRYGSKSLKLRLTTIHTVGHRNLHCGAVPAACDLLYDRNTEVIGQSKFT